MSQLLLLDLIKNMQRYNFYKILFPPITVISKFRYSILWKIAKAAFGILNQIKMNSKLAFFFIK